MNANEIPIGTRVKFTRTRTTIEESHYIVAKGYGEDNYYNPAPLSEWNLIDSKETCSYIIEPYTPEQLQKIKEILGRFYIEARYKPQVENKQK
jgi:hypothetical protein